jgi:hypothetical protein
MAADNRSFVARYSRILRKKLAIKYLAAFLTRQTIARFDATRRLFHLYLDTGSPADIPHVRADPGAPIAVSIPIDVRMQAHLSRYDHGLEGCLAPGQLNLATELRVYEVSDCDMLPWLGLVRHRPTGWIIDGQPDPQPRLVFRDRVVPGTVLSLLDTPRGHNHYFHFFEKLGMVMRALRWREPDEPISLLVRDKLSSFQRTAVDALARRRPNLTVVTIGNYEIVRPERLLLIKRTPCPMICWFAPIEDWREIGEMMREAYGPAQAPFGRKIHLSRKAQKVRRIANEDALADVFASNGYETIAPETLSHAEQVHLMMQADAIAAAEGAAITNIIFADKPIRLSLMCPREILNPFWEGLALQLGHDFDYVESGKAGWYDQFEVDPAALGASLAGER